MKVHGQSEVNVLLAYTLVFVCILALIFCSSAASANDASDGIGQTRIRFYTGNLTVDYFIHMGGGNPPGPDALANPDLCNRMKNVSVSAASDYPVWRMIEAEKGKWDWTHHENNARVLHEHGLRYNVFCWLHFPPQWFMDSADYVPYRCAEHDLPLEQTSIWSPGLLDVYDRFYGELAARFGDKIDFIRLATPAEYGEIGYPNGMTNWIVKQDHQHPGFWCNDAYARADFRTSMRNHYRLITRLNRAWGTNYKSFTELEYPATTHDRTLYKPPLETTPQERRRLLDFIEWYYGKQERFARDAINVVRKHFPDKEIIMSMGYGSQRTMFGNDDVGIAKMCRDMKVACQTPGNVGYFCMKSLSTPCRFYDVPYFTEPPGGVNRNEQVNRIWSDASCGTQTYFDYMPNLLGAKDIFAKYKDYLDGEHAIVDAAVFFPTTDHRLRDQDWPERTLDSANRLREYLDYDLVDERMILDGALSGYRMLVMYDGNVMQEKTLRALEQWVSNGGVMVVKDFGPVESIDGRVKGFWEDFRGECLLKSSRSPHTKEIGKGRLMLAIEPDSQEFARETAQAAHNLSKHSPAAVDIPMIDDSADGITATLFKDRIMYLNPSDKSVEKTVQLRESDFGEGSRTGKPVKWHHKLVMEPHSISHIDLR